ncbi:MAG: LON peptidase substrate-binding domain-containing protein [Verrucomicrobiota bacterium]|jgi:ATP-dependent Lon protease
MRLPSEVPVMTLPNVILFPQVMQPLHIFEPRYRRMLADALASHRMFAIAMSQRGHRRNLAARVAGLGLIRASVEGRDGTSNLILQGIARVELGEVVRRRPYNLHRMRPLPPTGRGSLEAAALAAKVMELVGERLELGFEPSPAVSGALGEPAAVQALREVLKHLAHLEDPEQLADLVSATLLPDARERQVILETRRLEERLRFLIVFLRHDIETRRNSQSE